MSIVKIVLHYAAELYIVLTLVILLLSDTLVFKDTKEYDKY